MSNEQRPILIVLDTSAILAYTRGSIHVGEPMAEVDNDGGVVGLPVSCLAEASWMVSDVDRLKLLAEHHATRLMTFSQDWPSLAETVETVGRMDAALAVLGAVGSGCDVLTACPGLYGGLEGGGPIIAIPR
jgi:hypothetical protein